MAWQGFFLSTWIHKIMQLIMSGYFIYPTSYAREEKKPFDRGGIEPRSGPLVSQATALTTRP